MAWHLKGQQRTQFQEQKSSFYTFLSIETQRHEVNEWCCRGEGEFAPSDTSLVGIEEETDSITKIVASVSDHVSSFNIGIITTTTTSPEPEHQIHLWATNPQINFPLSQLFPNSFSVNYIALPPRRSFLFPQG